MVTRLRSYLWSRKLGRCGAVARRLALTLRRLLPVRGVGPLANIVLGAPAPGRPCPAVAAVAGASFELDLREALHRVVFLDLFSLELRRVVLPLLRAGDLVVDVGANFGFWTVLAARRGCEVVAVEPVATTRRLLAANVERNGVAARVEIVAEAISDVPGTLTIAVPAGESGQASAYADGAPGAAEIVATETLDELIGERRVRFLKIDVEGHEWAVLRGAARVLSSGQVDHVLVEISSVVLERAQRSAEEIVDLLLGHGYVFTRFVTANAGLAPRGSYRDLGVGDLGRGAVAGDALWSRAGLAD